MGRQTSSCPTRAARVGGMRISVSTTWGSDCSTAASSSGRSVHNASMTTSSYAPSSSTMPSRTSSESSATTILIIIAHGYQPVAKR